MVIVALDIIDFKGIVFDSTLLDGFDSSQHIDAAKAINIALAFGQRHSGLFKNTADLGRCQVDLLAQHQRHAARHARGSHRGTAHIGVTIVGGIV